MPSAALDALLAKSQGWGVKKRPPPVPTPYQEPTEVGSQDNATALAAEATSLGVDLDRLISEFGQNPVEPLPERPELDLGPTTLGGAMKYVPSKGFDVLKQFATTPIFGLRDKAREFADEFDRPTLDRSPLEAAVRGFVSGAAQPAAEQLTPMNLALTVGGPLARSVSVARRLPWLGDAANVAKTVAEPAMVAQSAEMVKNAVAPEEGAVSMFNPNEPIGTGERVWEGLQGASMGILALLGMRGGLQREAQHSLTPNMRRSFVEAENAAGRLPTPPPPKPPGWERLSWAPDENQPMPPGAAKFVSREATAAAEAAKKKADVAAASLANEGKRAPKPPDPRQLALLEELKTQKTQASLAGDYGRVKALTQEIEAIAGEQPIFPEAEPVTPETGLVFDSATQPGAGPEVQLPLPKEAPPGPEPPPPVEPGAATPRPPVPPAPPAAPQAAPPTTIEQMLNGPVTPTRPAPPPTAIVPETRVAKGIVQPGLPVVEETAPVQRRYKPPEPPAEPTAVAPVEPVPPPPAPPAAEAKPQTIDDLIGQLTGGKPEPKVEVIEPGAAPQANASGAEQGAGTSAEAEGRFKVQKFGIVDPGGNLRPLVDATGVDVPAPKGAAKVIIEPNGDLTFVEGDQQAFAKGQRRQNALDELPQRPAAPEAPKGAVPPVRPEDTVVTQPRPGLERDVNADPILKEGKLVQDPNAFVVTDPTILNLDPERYQHKKSGKGGVTGTLSGITEWEPFSPPLLVHEQANGKLYVANGHQRYNRYMELRAEGKELPPLRVRIMRESDGVDVPTVRRMAAEQNIVEGTATPMDVAKLLREAPLTPKQRGKIAKGERSGIILTTAEGLKGLSDEAFRAIDEIGADPHGVATVAKYFDKPNEQVAAIQAIAKKGIDNYLDGEAYARKLKSNLVARREKGAQGDLFGNAEFEDITYVESQLERSFGKTLASRLSAVKNALKNKAFLEESGTATVSEGGASVKTDLSGLKNLYATYKDMAGSATNNAIRKMAGELYAKRVTEQAAADYVSDALRRDIDTGGYGDGKPAENATVQPGAGGRGDGQPRTAPEAVPPAEGESTATVAEAEEILRKGAAALNKEAPPVADMPPLTLTGEKATEGMPPPTKAELEAAGQGDMFAEPSASAPDFAALPQPRVPNLYTDSRITEVKTKRQGTILEFRQAEDGRNVYKVQWDDGTASWADASTVYEPKRNPAAPNPEDLPPLPKTEAQIKAEAENPELETWGADRPENIRGTGAKLLYELEQDISRGIGGSFERLRARAEQAGISLPEFDKAVETYKKKWATVRKRLGVEEEPAAPEPPKFEKPQKPQNIEQAITQAPRTYRESTTEEYQAMSRARNAAIDAATQRGTDLLKKVRASRAKAEGLFEQGGAQAVIDYWNKVKAEIEKRPVTNTEWTPPERIADNAEVIAPPAKDFVIVRFEGRATPEQSRELGAAGFKFKEGEWIGNVEGPTNRVGRPRADLIADAKRIAAGEAPRENEPVQSAGTQPTSSSTSSPVPPPIEAPKAETKPAEPQAPPTIEKIAEKKSLDTPEEQTVIGEEVQKAVDKAIEKIEPEPPAKPELDEMIDNPQGVWDKLPGNVRSYLMRQAGLTREDINNFTSVEEARDYGKRYGENERAKAEAAKAENARAAAGQPKKLTPVEDLAGYSGPLEPKVEQWVKLIEKKLKGEPIVDEGDYSDFVADQANRIARAKAIRDEIAAIEKDRAKPLGEESKLGPVAAPNLVEEAIELADRFKAQASEGAVVEPREMMRQAREREALLANGSPLALRRYGEMLAKVYARLAEKGERGGTATKKVEAEIPRTEGGELIGSGFGALQGMITLAKKNPTEFKRIMVSAGIGGAAGATADEEDRWRGMMLGLAAGATAAIVAPANAAQLAKLTAAAKKLRLYGKEPGETALRREPRADRDLNLFEVLSPLNPESVVPEAYRKATKIMDDLNNEMAYGKLAGEDRAIQKSVAGDYVKEAVRTLRELSKEATDAGLTKKGIYINRMADALSKRPTKGQMSSMEFAKATGLDKLVEKAGGKLGYDYIERATGITAYRVLTGYALDTALQNLTQPILAMRHVGVGDLLWAYKMSRTQWAKDQTKHIHVIRPTDLEETSPGVAATKGASEASTATDWLKDPQRLIAKSDNFNRRVVYLAAMRAAERNGLMGSYAREWARAAENQTFTEAYRTEADGWARSVMRDTQGDIGPIAVNPLYRGPLGGSIRPFTKFPTLLFRNLLDAAFQPDSSGRNRFFMATAAAVFLGKKLGLDLEDTLLMGGRPFGIDVTKPREALKKITSLDVFPVVKGAADVWKHVQGTANHPILPTSLDDFFNSDLSYVGLTRYPTKVGAFVKRTLEEGAGDRVVRTPSGAVKELTALEDLMGLTGFKATRPSQLAKVTSDASGELYQGEADRKAKAKEIVRQIRVAHDAHDAKTVAKLQQELAQTTRSSKAVINAMQGIDRTQWERILRQASPRVRAQLVEKYGELIEAYSIGK